MRVRLAGEMCACLSGRALRAGIEVRWGIRKSMTLARGEDWVARR
jgi:hypothetical protein